MLQLPQCPLRLAGGREGHPGIACRHSSFVVPTYHVLPFNVEVAEELDDLVNVGFERDVFQGQHATRLTKTFYHVIHGTWMSAQHVSGYSH